MGTKEKKNMDGNWKREKGFENTNKKNDKRQ